MVSMSFEKGVEGEVRLPEMEGLTIFRQGRRMSQFEHNHAGETKLGEWDVHRHLRRPVAGSASGGVRDMLQECKGRGVRPAYVVSKTIAATKEDDPPGLERAEDVTALFERGVISKEVFDKKDPRRMEGGNYMEYGVSMRTLRGFSEENMARAARA